MQSDDFILDPPNCFMSIPKDSHAPDTLRQMLL